MNRRFTAAEKSAILAEIDEGREGLRAICRRIGIDPALTRYWRRMLAERGSLERARSGPKPKARRPIQELPCPPL